MFASRCRRGLLSTVRRFNAHKTPLRAFSARHSAVRLADNHNFANGTNAAYADSMYQSWNADPNSVHSSWDAYFRSGSFITAPEPGQTIQVSASTGGGDGGVLAQVSKLIRAYQVRGHLLAKVDPLQLPLHFRDQEKRDKLTKELSTAHLDMDAVVQLDQLRALGLTGFDGETMTVHQITQRLQDIYCTGTGWEFMHIPDVEHCSFIRGEIESQEKHEFTKVEKAKLLERLVWSDHFERFLAKKYTTAKRFGLEGCESLIPGMKALIDEFAVQGTSDLVFGMPHRGRLNVLANVISKPMEQIFCEFDPNDLYLNKIDSDNSNHSGDVKYHLGMSHNSLRGPERNIPMHLTLLANPSHLEAVNPVALGKVRARQLHNNNRKGSAAVILHGDAAFSGQGVVYETLGLGDLPDYETGGTIHIVANNQIGFTTDPYMSRSSPYCTDVAKGVNAPIFHVNGDDPEAVHRACSIAARYRNKFSKDCVVDIVCYRKHGHNEIDEPMFTQPHMYEIIKKQQSVLDIYKNKLVTEGSFTQAEVDAVDTEVYAKLEEKFAAAKTYIGSENDWLDEAWENIVSADVNATPQTTGASSEVLEVVSKALTAVPEDFAVHRRLKGILKKKQEALEAGDGLDWATAEGLAFGSLLLGGTHVRLSGQDVERGTFSHRHAVLHDQKKEHTTYTHLKHLSADQAPFSVSNSSLSEFGVLGFELGYAMENPNQLVMWEAQFGDFFNGAQIIIDQFLSSGEDKWMRQSGLVMMLPHGYEGMGPEHSSGRVERFLQNSNQDVDTLPSVEEYSQLIQNSNWQVCNVTTPANYFHVLRRQVMRDFRKPLVLMTPKSLLRHPLAKSSVAEMTGDTKFQPLIGEAELTVDPSAVRKVLYCSGKVYYDLLAYRRAENITDVAITRVEQIAPFPMLDAQADAKQYPNAELLWVQEEPKNMGSYFFTRHALKTSVSVDRPDLADIGYVGRASAASTSTGDARVHAREQAALVTEAFE